MKLCISNTCVKSVNLDGALEATPHFVAKCGYLYFKYLGVVSLASETYLQVVIHSLCATIETLWVEPESDVSVAKAWELVSRPYLHKHKYRKWSEIFQIGQVFLGVLKCILRLIFLFRS